MISLSPDRNEPFPGAGPRPGTRLRGADRSGSEAACWWSGLRIRPIPVLLALLVGATAFSAPTSAVADRVEPEQEIREPEQEIRTLRAELEDELEFLRRAERAFLFSHRSTTEVKRRIRDVEELLERLDQDPREVLREVRDRRTRRSALEKKLEFLDRAERAFLFSHRSTTEVKRRIRIVEQRLRDLEDGQ